MEDFLYMEVIKILSAIVAAIAANADVLLMGVIGLLSALVAISMAIPGDQPEKALQKAVDFLSKFSKKPKSE
jgi:hypothetical protein